MERWQVKGRSKCKAIAVCLASVDEIGTFGDTAGLPAGLLEALLPGPMTILLKRMPSAPVCEALTAGLDTLALRVPGADVNAMWKRPSGEGQSFCRALAASGGPLALTSANPTKQSSSLSTEEFRGLWQEVAYVFDGGLLGQEDDRQGSTIVDLTSVASHGVFHLVRAGAGLEVVQQVMKAFHLIQRDPSGSEDGVVGD